MYDVVLFDLDGTLSDSKPGIEAGIKYALSKYGIKIENDEQMRKYLGPPIRDSFREFNGFDEETCEQAVAYYREYYSEKGLFENNLYPGMKDLLSSLKAAGKILLTATSKPQEYTDRIVDYFGIRQYFDFIAGSNMDGTRNRKAEVIRYSLDSADITDFSKTVMVGDRKYDILGAKEIGIDSIGVLYGYGNREEFEEAGATFIVENVADIAKFI
ncbi:MAG: HAD family hydrolase [Lachnospiraceae bacterium]|nr:HAD family hydrolase [Lachnospiraceae bacterium]